MELLDSKEVRDILKTYENHVTKEEMIETILSFKLPDAKNQEHKVFAENQENRVFAEKFAEKHYELCSRIRVKISTYNGKFVIFLTRPTGNSLYYFKIENGVIIYKEKNIENPNDKYREIILRWALLLKKRVEN